MKDEELNFTYFAPAERADMEEIKEQAKAILQSPDFKKLTSAIPSILMILNSDRQIVFSNDSLAKLLGIESIEELKGQRPGEVLGCIHSKKNAGGCGTSENCEMCGAVNSIMAGLDGTLSINECRILTGDGTDAFDLKVWATPYVVDNEKYVIFAVEDIGSEKRRKVLEKTFFHDITNTAGGIKGIAQLLKDSPGDLHEFKDMLFEAANTLMDEINAQRQLLAAESNELALNLYEVNSINLMKSVMELYKNHQVAENKIIRILDSSDNVNFVTDETLAKRIIGNMVKNALEAIRAGNTVTISCKEQENSVDISVHNDSVMPREVKLQMFQRSFSTKGAGRGIGTYSMKLLLEKYLKGKISFTSEEGEGTTFTAAFRKDMG
jgi:PAS domain-containing protein